MSERSGTDEQTRTDRTVLAAAAVIYVAGLTLFATTRPGATGSAAAPSAEEVVSSAASTPSAPAPVDVQQPTPFARHTIALTLAPGRGSEFKYRVAKGAGFVYSWRATGPVSFEFHGEPDGAAPGYADTYRTGDGADGAGSFTAPSTGIHGWYWENRDTTPVTVTLTAAGFFTEALELKSSGPVSYPIQR